jgi:hypothetical protein
LYGNFNRKREDEIKNKSSPLKLMSQSQPNFAEMILGWSPFKIVSVSAVLYPRLSPLLKIEISSNGQNCSILVGVLKCRAQIWKRTTQESFQISLVEIGSVVSEEKIFKKFHPPFFLICIIGLYRLCKLGINEQKII